MLIIDIMENQKNLYLCTKLERGYYLITGFNFLRANFRNEFLFK